MIQTITLLRDTKKDELNAYQKHYFQILKGTLIDIAHDATDDCYGLVFRMPNEEVKTAWISRDEEGNGPGFLDIR